MIETGPQGDAENHPSSTSLRGLDGLNFLMADVQGGIGPYLSVYLAGARHWQASDIGVVLAVGGLVGVIFQVPAGFLVDRLSIKRLLIAGSGVVIAIACLATAASSGFWPIVSAQVLIGIASAIIGPAIAAITLGLVGKRAFDGRTSRNQTFNHFGNFAAAILIGALGQHLGYAWIFYLVCAFAAASAIVTLMIRPSEIDNELARGGEGRKDATGRSEPLSLRDFFKRRDLMIFLFAVGLFHFGNAAMLPMAGQVLAKAHPGQDTLALSACIIAAQFVMMGVAWGVGLAMRKGVGRKPIFLVAFAVLPIRGLLFAFTSNPFEVVAIQLLDGVAAGIFGVISIVIAADIMKGTGRFNVAQGLVAVAVGVGASLSSVTSGYVVTWFGFQTGFLYLAVVALVALTFFALLMPETRDAYSPGPRPSGSDTDGSGRSTIAASLAT